jgi:hypothetical protein
MVKTVKQRTDQIEDNSSERQSRRESRRSTVSTYHHRQGE